MKIDFAYMEVAAKTTVSNLNAASLQSLEQTMFRTQIHTFGWPIAAVMFEGDFKPQAIQAGIECTINAPGHRDFWTLKRTGEFYFIGELFENNRDPSRIFIDTRTNRVAESFMRLGALYSALGVPADEEIHVLIAHGNIAGRILGASNSARIFPVERKVKVNEVKTPFLVPLGRMCDPEVLKANVYQAIHDLGEMFDMFNPDKASFTDPIVEAFRHGRIL